jgi:hypothetical protein
VVTVVVTVVVIVTVLVAVVHDNSGDSGDRASGDSASEW